MDSDTNSLSSQANERRKIAVQVDQPVEIDHDPHQNHHHTCADFNLAYMRLEPLHYPTCLIKAEAKEQKGESHAERVEQQQQNTLSQRRGSGGQAENRAEKEANTGRPADGKNNADQQ